MLQETNYSGERLGWGDHLTRIATQPHSLWDIIRTVDWTLKIDDTWFAFMKSKVVLWPSTHSFHASWFPFVSDMLRQGLALHTVWLAPVWHRVWLAPPWEASVCPTGQVKPPPKSEWQKHLFRFPLLSSLSQKSRKSFPCLSVFVVF